MSHTLPQFVKKKGLFIAILETQREQHAHSLALARGKDNSSITEDWKSIYNLGRLCDVISLVYNFHENFLW